MIETFEIGFHDVWRLLGYYVIIIINAVFFTLVLFLLCRIWILILSIKKSSNRRQAENAITPIVFASLLVGVAFSTAGYLIGVSRESAIGDVLPAILGLMSGLGAIFLTSRKEKMLLIVVVILAASENLWMGANLGALARERGSILNTYREVELEFLIRNHRINLGLEPDMEETGAD